MVESEPSSCRRITSLKSLTSVASSPSVEAKQEAAVVETTLVSEILSGMIVTCMQIPASCAYAGLGNMPPTMGLTSAWIIGLFGALLQGAPGTISGSTAAAGSVTSEYITEDLDDQEKQEYKQILLLAAMVSSAWWFLAAYSGVGRFLQLIPTTVMIGFANGLGLTIGWAQLKPFMSVEEDESLVWMIVIAIASMIIVYILPNYAKKIPPALVAIASVTVLEQLMLRPILNVKTPTIEGLLQDTQMNEPPKPFWMAKSWNSSLIATNHIYHAQQIVEISLQLTFSGVVESLMTVKAIGEMTGIQANYERHLCALGLGNFFAGFFGGMAGNTLSSLSLMNVRSGGQGFPSQITTVIAFLLSIFVFGRVLVLIPVAGLSGVMLMVVYNMIKWFSVKLIFCSLLPSRFSDGFEWKSRYTIKEGDALVILVVTLCINLINLMTGFLIGIALASLIYAWESLQRIQVRESLDGKLKVYDVYGHLFFGACGLFEKHFDVANDPKEVEVRLENADLFDYSALETLNNLIAKYKAVGKSLKLTNIQGESNKLIDEFGGSQEFLGRHAFEGPKVKGWYAYVGDKAAADATPREQLLTHRGRSTVLDDYVDRMSFASAVSNRPPSPRRRSSGQPTFATELADSRTKSKQRTGGTDSDQSTGFPTIAESFSENKA